MKILGVYGNYSSCRRSFRLEINVSERGKEHGKNNRGIVQCKSKEG